MKPPVILIYPKTMTLKCAWWIPIYFIRNTKIQ